MSKSTVKENPTANHPALGRWGVTLGHRLFRVERVTQIRGALDGPTHMFTGRGLQGERISTRVPTMLMDVDSEALDRVGWYGEEEDPHAETIDDILETEVRPINDPEEISYR